MSSPAPPDCTDMARSADISHDGLYRWCLSRVWNEALPRVAFIMLNPSTADAEVDDPTIRRCINFARAFRNEASDEAFDRAFGGLDVVNLYAFRATDPRDLFAHSRSGDIVGESNDTILTSVATRSSRVIAAWGAKAPADRVQTVCELLRDVDLYALRLTKAGAPGHPLYLPRSCVPGLWKPAGSCEPRDSLGSVPAKPGVPVGVEVEVAPG